MGEMAVEVEEIGRAFALMTIDSAGTNMRNRPESLSQRIASQRRPQLAACGSLISRASPPPARGTVQPKCALECAKQHRSVPFSVHL